MLRPAAAAATPAAARPALVSAGPIVETTDYATRTTQRVTFSPDGDGNDDAVTIRVRATPGDKLSFWIRPLTRVSFTIPAGTAHPGVTTLDWNGLQPDGTRFPDGNYSLKVCDVRTKLCSNARVLAHLRVVSVYVRTATAVSSGQTLRVEISSDRAGPFTIELVSGATPAGEGIGQASVPRAGSAEYRVPQVPNGGLWLLRVRSGDARSQFPLVVHEPSLSLDAPPPHTALVVYPLLTWRAYDVADGNRDGRVDSWYAHPSNPLVPLYGPYEPPATDPSLAGREPNPGSQTAFAGWLLDHHLTAQHVTDVELGDIPASVLQRYAMIAFEGHTEYYETATYAKVKRYRDAGGRLYFFQGNSFYGAARVGRTTVERLSYRYRTRARSDFGLAVTGFRSCCWPASIRPVYRLARGVVEKLPWAFAGTGLKDGDAFGVADGEVDTVDAALSPPGTVTVASSVVPPFKPSKDEEPAAWLGRKRIPYPAAWLRPERIAIAYARTGKGEVFSWANTGFLKSVRFRTDALSQSEREQLDRVALNVWERFTR
ncbi:MAG TPA: N,N-dimethylformamidase beta subunit family domain-containing protein [Gaiellaceae bacterium]|nr:N,N-dimethylformamidase beta subunit family domain-containing protein [Gaiellaceae bacterium]